MRVDDPAIDPKSPLATATTKELLDEVIDRLQVHIAMTPNNDCVRNYAAALHRIEDGQMRYTRGRAIFKGKFNPGDLDRIEED